MVRETETWKREKWRRSRWLWRSRDLSSLKDQKCVKRGGSNILLFVLFAAIALSACGKGEQGGLSGPVGEAEGQQGEVATEPPAFPEQAEAYEVKAQLLKEKAMEDWVRQELGLSPAGEAGHAVFLSVCDTTKRASVFTGTGDTLEEAWETADTKARTAVGASGLEPVWVKADVTYLSEQIGMDELESTVGGSRPGHFRYGVAFDPAFETALLEAELNSAEIYAYGESEADGEVGEERTEEEAGIDLEHLNAYLKENGRETLETLPEECTVFQCVGWICEEGSPAQVRTKTGQMEADAAEAKSAEGGSDYAVWQLSGSGLSYGGRQLELVDDACVKEMIRSASAFLADQVQEDGHFAEEINGRDIASHAGAVWALLCGYQADPDPELAGTIDRAVGHMLEQVVYDEEGRAYLYEEKEDEIKLGGCALAVVALTGYMDVFQTDEHVEVCKALGEGILSLLDPETGAYYHVLNGDFSQKEESRTVYYDGEATFALCRLYGLTEEEKWLDGAERAIGHFIQEDYVQYIDHWAAYSLNEFTKYRPDETEIYVFAMRNALENLDKIYQQETAYPAYLELLMAVFETYERMQENGMIVGDDAREMLLKVIYARADRMRNGYIYPEYAMYMADPQQVLGAFMVRHDGLQVRIDDVQRDIGGYHLYLKDYDRMVEDGLLEAR